MKTNSSAALLAGAAATLLATSVLAAGFSGPTAPANFTVTDTGALTGPSTLGTATFSALQLLLVGSNSSGAGCTGGVYSVLSSPCQLQVAIGQPGVYSFNWSYVTADPDGPAGDIFGVLVDGKQIALSDLGGSIAQLGSSSFAAASSFGWFINCTDCTGSFANATVSSFAMAPVAEPAPWLLLAAGLGGVGAALRRGTIRRPESAGRG